MGESEVVSLEEYDEMVADEASQNPGPEDEMPIDRPRYQALLAERRSALAKDPRNVKLLNEVGEIAEVLGDMDRARWAYKRAIRLDPNYADAYRNLGQLYERESRKKPALSAYQHYLRFAGDAGDIDVIRQHIQKLLGGDDESAKAYCQETPACTELNKRWKELGLTPGEALYLIDPENSDGREMMRYTLLDMITKGVLVLDEKNGVGKGEKYDTSTLDPHEVPFAKYYARYSDYIDLDRLAQTVALELNNRFDLYKNEFVRRSLLEKGYIKKGSQRVGGVLPVQRYEMTDKGKRASSQLKRLLKETGIQIDRVGKTNPQQADAFVSDGGPALLLMNAYPPGYFQKWLETLDRMGLGPAIQRTKSRLLGASSSDLVDQIIKSFFGS